MTHIDRKFLTRYPSFNQFINKSGEETSENEKTKDENQTPLELVEANYNILKNKLEDAIRKNFKMFSHFFERLIVQLLVARGYGGSVKDAVEAIGKLRDKGVDGIAQKD